MSDEANTMIISGVSSFFIRSGALSFAVDHAPPVRSRTSIEGGAYLFVYEAPHIVLVVGSLDTLRLGERGRDIIFISTPTFCDFGTLVIEEHRGGKWMVNPTQSCEGVPKDINSPGKAGSKTSQPERPRDVELVGLVVPILQDSHDS